MHFTTLTVPTLFLATAWALVPPPAPMTSGPDAAVTSAASLSTDLPNSSQLTALVSGEEAFATFVLSVLEAHPSSFTSFSSLTSIYGSVASAASDVPSRVAQLESDPALLSKEVFQASLFSSVGPSVSAAVASLSASESASNHSFTASPSSHGATSQSSQGATSQSSQGDAAAAPTGGLAAKAGGVAVAAGVAALALL